MNYVHGMYTVQVWATLYFCIQHLFVMDPMQWINIWSYFILASVFSKEKYYIKFLIYAILFVDSMAEYLDSGGGRFGGFISSMQRSFKSATRAGNTYYPSTLQSVASLRCGWLKKQGGVVRSWQLRWFSLKDKTLFYFSNDDESKALGSIYLEGHRVIELPQTNEQEKFLFEIVPGMFILFICICV